MKQLFVKICGITRAQDAELAAGLGASALGFVFWPNSPRCVDAETARAIAANVPANVLKVGVFVDQPAEEVARIMDEVGLDVAQLHGHESPEYCRELKRTIFKSVGVKDNGSVNIDEFASDVVLLVDAHDPTLFGGTGKTVNWDSAREIAATRRTILAGGLNTANVKLAVRSVRPYGVDVSSGVESSPGVKDPTRLRTFFEALHD
ncbi:MAG TPA: phosphoribosylanthranilate isomerase [Burkholderiales bacterium]|nr:phosphoribosylanthranilate isomerase [Burkholderiales bacterium]